MNQIDSEEFVKKFVVDDCFVDGINRVVADVAGPENQGLPYLEGIREVITSAPQEVLDILPELIALGAHSSLFSLLAYFDNVRPIVDGFETELSIALRSGDEYKDLNPDEDFHDIFQHHVLQWRESAVARRGRPN
ncbi:hypothetical protein [Gordonia sp. (in: high G+C Gram-positive bacteria)]|uniref:hypothetical protein n=1 Tax=Gordonia sp. (in: high G+C Gram-positive bacteria) TaxID=84139 RepID=UPI003F9A2C54